MRKPLRTAALAGFAGAAYSLVEARRYKLTRLELPAGAGPFTILHVSDTHLTSKSPAAGFLAGLNDRLGEPPDLIAATGDLIEDDGGIEPAVELLGALRARYGKFYVLGSHDYYQSDRPSYLKYFTEPSAPRKATRADSARLEAGLQAAGWVPLTNRSETIDAAGRTVLVSGVDDPYISRHTTAHIARGPGIDLAIALVHAPDVVSEWALNSFDLVVAGHTHAGQVRIPGFGAVVTNCSLPAALAGGAHRIGRTWLHVSPGLGTGRFAPIRFGARPEVTLISLT